MACERCAYQKRGRPFFTSTPGAESMKQTRFGTSGPLARALSPQGDAHREKRSSTVFRCRPLSPSCRGKGGTC
jgi:hypothetical protein